MSAANVAHHHVSPHPSGIRGEGGATKVKTVVKPMSINPTKNVELVLEPVKEFKDSVMVVVVSEKFQTSLTISRPFGTTEIDHRNSYVVSTSVDLAYVNLENPGKLAADKQFEKVAIEEYIKQGMFDELNGHVYYVVKTKADELLTLEDYTREDHISHAKRERDAAVKQAKKDHAAAEIQAGRTGQMRPNGLGRAPKPREFDATKIDWMDFLGEVQPLEKAFLDFKKTSKVLDPARAGRKAYLSQYSTKIGSSNSVEQKEARALRGTSANLAPSKIVRIIQDALSNADYSDEDNETGEVFKFINSGTSGTNQVDTTTGSGKEKPPTAPEGTNRFRENPDGSPAASGNKPGASQINGSTTASLINELGALANEGAVATFGDMDEFVNSLEAGLNAKRVKNETGLLDPLGRTQLSASDLKQLDVKREKYPVAVKEYFRMRAESTDHIALRKKFNAMSPDEKAFSKEALYAENHSFLLAQLSKPK